MNGSTGFIFYNNLESRNKAVVHTGIKTGAGLINSGSKAVKQTADELRHDPELLRAGKELRDAKDKMKSFFSRKFGGKSTGISTF